MELSETRSALNEIENAGDEVFKIIGQLMLKTEKSKIKPEDRLLILPVSGVVHIVQFGENVSQIAKKYK